MFTRRAAYLAWLLAAPAWAPAVEHADDANNAKVAESALDSALDSADDELLEYLGSVDAEGQDWMEYLTHTDSAQSAQLKRRPGAGEEQEK